MLLTVVINPVLKMFKQILTLLCGLIGGGFVAGMLQTHHRNGNGEQPIIFLVLKGLMYYLEKLVSVTLGC